MRHSIAAFATFAFLAAQAAAQDLRTAQTPPPAVTLGGQIVADLDGRPLANAVVSLAPADSGGASPSTRTDAFGRFALTVSAAPRYRIAARKAGFAVTDIPLASPDPVVIRMLRNAVVSGRVVDEFGEPVLAAHVVAEDAASADVLAEAETDDRGEYRLGMPPDETFRLVAVTQGIDESGAVAGRVRVVQPEFRTYFPDAERIEDAMTMRLGAGEERSTLDFTVPMNRSGRQRYSAVDAAPALLTGGSPDPGIEAGQVSGVVLDEEGRTLASAQVVLLLERGGAGRFVERSDAGGQFVFSLVPSGPVRLMASKPGYATGEIRVTTFTNGDRREEVDLRLSQWSAVNGRVLDEYGEPVEGARVQLLRIQYSGGARRLASAGAVAPRTDDRGVFRVYGIEPGRYLLGVDASDEVSGDSSGYPRAYYPAAATPVDAQIILIASAEDRAFVDVRLARTPTYRVTGRLFAADGRRASTATVQLWPAARSTTVGGVPVTAQADPGGGFSFAGVLPGAYVVQAYEGRQAASVEGEFGSLNVIVGDADQTGLMLRMTAGSTLAGVVLFDTAGGAAEPSRAEIEITPIPADLDSSPPANWATAGVGPDWRFSMAGVTGVRRLQVTRVPDGWTVREIRINGADVTDRPVAFGGADTAAAQVEIVLQDRSNALLGLVTDEQGNPLGDAHLVLFSVQRDDWYFGSRYLRQATTAANGAYQVTGLAPGSYYAAVLPAADDDPEAWQDPENLEELSRAASMVTIGESERVPFNLRR